MLIVKRSDSLQEKQKIIKTLNTLNLDNAIHIYTYWNKDKCVGGSWLDAQYPHYLNMEYYDKSAVIVRAIYESFIELFKIKISLTARIKSDNVKSLKMTKQLGFYTLYKKDGFIVKEITPKTWKYQKKYPFIW